MEFDQHVLDCMHSSPFFQTLNTISAEKNSTIVFPLPIDLITYFIKSKEAVENRKVK